MSKNKRTIRRLISAVLCFSLIAVGMTSQWSPLQELPVSAKTLEELQEERKNNEQKIAEKQKELDALQSDLKENEEYQKTLQEKITLQQQNLDLVSEELERIQDSIDKTAEQISETEDEITVMEADIAVGLEEFKLRLRAMYVQGNGGLASALVGSTDFYDLLSKYELMSRIANHDNELVNDLKDKLETCNEKKAQLETEKTNLEEQQSDQQEKRDEFKTQLADLQNTYAETDEAKEQMERQKEQLNTDVEALNEQNEALDAEEEKIKEDIAKQQELIRQEALKKQQEEQLRQQQQQGAQNAGSASDNTDSSNNNSSDNSSSGSSGNTASEDTDSSDTGTSAPSSGTGFAWPCPGYYTISSGFGSRWGTTHGAIDIAGGNAGASIVASKGGTVVRVVTGCSHNYAKNSSCGCGGGYGNYVVIQHDGTYSTLYGHMATVSVSVGQTVSQGQTIGTVGCTGFSTGFHLHFELRVNGTKVDPMQYL